MQFSFFSDLVYFISLSVWFLDEKITEIDPEDLETIEDVFEHIAESKHELGTEVVDLEALKEDITEYQEVSYSHFTS